MRKNILIIFGLLVLIIVYGCEENFSPKAEFEQQYVLNSILRADTNYQVVTLSSNYDVEGTNPLNNTNDPSIQNAVVEVLYDGQTYLFRDTILADQKSTLYDLPIKYYYNDHLTLREGHNVEIKAEINDKLLSSNSKVPYLGNLSFYVGDGHMPGNDNDSLKMQWYLDADADEDIIFVTKFFIEYYHEAGGIKTYHRYEVPIKYYDDGSPQYKYPLTGYTSFNVKYDVVNTAMENLSGDDPDKSNYTIIDGRYELFAYDAQTARYYLSQNAFDSGLTILIDQPQRSNIDGGYGLFGTVVKKSAMINFDDNYVRNFGYKPL